MSENLKYRMMGLVPYNLSPIQQGIQFGHALQEFNNMINDEFDQDQRPMDFEQWADKDKTFIILNGGTTNNHYDTESESYKGSLNNHGKFLYDLGVKTGEFYEPDLGDQLTAVVFLVDERVWDKEKYPDRNFGVSFEPGMDLTNVLDVHREPETEEAYTKRLGGEQNVKLREFLSQFKLV